MTLTLPLQAVQQGPTGLESGATGLFTAMEATIPALPGNEAALLAWGAVLNQVSFLAVMAMLFLLALRLLGENLFTPASVWIVGASGVVLAAAGNLGQALDAIARNRIAELIGANQRTAGETAGMSLTELSRRVGVSLANLSVLKNDRAKAIRFSTLTALCEVLECQVGDLFSHGPAGK